MCTNSYYVAKPSVLQGSYSVLEFQDVLEMYWNFRSCKMSWNCPGFFFFVLESMYILPRLLPCDYCRHNYVLVICAQQFLTFAKCVLKNAEFVLEFHFPYVVGTLILNALEPQIISFQSYVIYGCNAHFRVALV
jgi:hypothetical protein